MVDHDTIMREAAREHPEMLSVAIDCHVEFLRILHSMDGAHGDDGVRLLATMLLYTIGGYTADSSVLTPEEADQLVREGAMAFAEWRAEYEGTGVGHS